jgi:cystathionine beta-lyase/cystathionine gamma-synthase
MGVAVTSNDEIFERLKFLQNSIGGVPSPFDCFMANRGLKTLHISAYFGNASKDTFVTKSNKKLM